MNKFCAILDIQGFKELYKRKGISFVYDSLMDIQIKNGELDSKAYIIPFLRHINTSNVFSTQCIYFSDTIVFYTKDDSIDSLIHLAFHLQYYLRESLLAGIPMCCGVGHGELIVSPDRAIIVGQALINAYEAQKDLLLYGMACHNSIEQWIQNMPQKYKYKRNLPALTIRDKSRIKGAILINLFKLMYLDFNFGSTKCLGIMFLNKDERYDQLIIHLKEMRNQVFGRPRLFVENTIEYLAQMKDLRKNRIEIPLI